MGLHPNILHTHLPITLPLVCQLQEQKKDKCLALLAHNIDPQTHAQKQIAERKTKLNHTFYKLSQDWLSHQDYKPNTLDGTNRYLSYAYEFIKDKPVSDLTAFDILDICQAIHDKHGSLMASGVKTKIAQVLDFAMTRRLISYNVARGLKNTHKKHKKGHNPAIIDPQNLVKLLNAIDNADDCGVVVKTFLQIAPYVFVRPTGLPVCTKMTLILIKNNGDTHRQKPKTARRHKRLYRYQGKYYKKFNSCLIIMGKTMFFILLVAKNHTSHTNALLNGLEKMGLQVRRPRTGCVLLLARY